MVTFYYNFLRSPTLTLTSLFSLCSIVLMILTIIYESENSSNYQFKLFIIFPPLNCLIFILFSLTWIERTSLLTYVPIICLGILMFSNMKLTIISCLFLSSSIVMYFNMIYYGFLTIFFLSIIISISIAYAYGSLYIHRYRNMMTIEQQNGEIPNDISSLNINKYIIQCSNKNMNELILYMSKLPGRRIRHDIRNIHDDLQQIQAQTIITLNETKELSFMNMINDNYDINIYSNHVKQANIEHIIYPIRDRFIPISINDYMKFIYNIILNVNDSNRNHILVHCMGGMGRTGMTIVCLELFYEYLMEDKIENQRFIERLCHYPFLLKNYCRVCQIIFNVRQARKGTIHNPLQIMFVHEFYARLKSSSYMNKFVKCSIN